MKKKKKKKIDNYSFYFENHAQNIQNRIRNTACNIATKQDIRKAMSCFGFECPILDMSEIVLNIFAIYPHG